jgi:hypothetical protein
MTTPPDFGGEAIEEGVQEDLGGPSVDHAGVSHHDADSALLSDNEAHAPGETCEICGAPITPGQDVRRRADGRWMHEVCPGPL